MEETKKLAKPEKQPHHITFQDAIRGLRYSVNRLESLIDEIQGTEQPSTEGEGQTSLPLAAFLDTEGEPIQHESERIDKIREELRGLLF